jgi:Zn finger protein HypA/HybF involved in hydrogenase expression
MAVDYNVAAHRLRMTPRLLKWCTSYAPRSDKRKLAEVAPESGTFDELELAALDAHLRSDWGTKSVPSGIRLELSLEAKGTCGLCKMPCDKLEAAHVDRKDIEVAFYFQHSHNLLLVCPTCHARYDDLGLKGLTNEVVRQAKLERLNDLMRAVDDDVTRARAVELAVEEAKAAVNTSLAAFFGTTAASALWRLAPGQLLKAAADSAHLDAPPTLDPADGLQLLSGSLTGSTVTGAVLDGYAMEASGTQPYTPGDEWEHMEAEPDEGTCTCGNTTELDQYECEECGHVGFNDNPPAHVARNTDGFLVPSYEDFSGDSEELRCEKCKSGRINCSFNEFCSACQHQSERDD